MSGLQTEAPKRGRKPNGSAALETASAHPAAAPHEESEVAETAADKETPSQDYPVAASTLTGDLRDFILDRLRHEQDKRPWNERNEAEQRATVLAVEAAARDIVTKAVQVIAAAGRSTIKATLEQVTIKDGIKAVLLLAKDDPHRHALCDSTGMRVLVAVADPDQFDGEREPAKILPDQGDLVSDAMAVHSEADSAAEQAS